MHLLYHVSDFRVEVLDPANYREKCICLSEDVFIGALGQYLYIFDYRRLSEHFHIETRGSGGQAIRKLYNKAEYIYESQPLGKEYRISAPIDTREFAIGIAQNFDVLKGMLTKRLNGEIISREAIDFGKTNR